MQTSDHHQLQNWFLRKKRDLPWRRQASPYAVWVSEVMLQQTQVSTVIPYFERWVARFPDIESLAKADETEIIKMWEGLGYYSRARNLHAGAKKVASDFHGTLPHCPEKLASIKGLGPYTIGAIRAFAFKKKAAAVDGNVLRVISRWLGFDQDIQKPSSQKHIREYVEEHLPDHQPWVSSEALIELGATVCKPKNPQCPICPLNESCTASREGRTDELPVKLKKVRYEKLHRAVALIHSEGCFLVRQCADGEIMAGLYEFPYWTLRNEDLDEGEVIQSIQNHWSIRPSKLQALPRVQHSFTKYRATLYPWMGQSQHASVPGFSWVGASDLKRLAFSSGHRKILEKLESHHGQYFTH